jgi:hypothetical protein
MQSSKIGDERECFVSLLLSATTGATSNPESLLDSSCRVVLAVLRNKDPASLSMLIVTNEIMVKGLVDT